ncbi:MAG: gluconate:H+ symporter [Bacteroidota bacterium]|nr:gluconate:H+ symporter [Bacteroidota bacterium]
MLLLLCIAAILLLILMVVYFKLDTFISFLIVSILLGIAVGMNIQQISGSVTKGIGNTLGPLVIILGFGAMLGKLVADSGAAQQITASLTKIFGTKNIQWGMALAGLVIGIPLFYTAGFIVVVPLIFAIAATTRLPLLYIGVPMLAALSVAHGFLPPHPSPTAIAEQLHASISKTLIYGIIIAIPTIVLAGPLFAKTLRKYNPSPTNTIFQIHSIPENELPGIGISLVTALMPVILLAVTALVLYVVPATSGLGKVMQFLGDPNIAMLLSVLIAVYFLGMKRGNKIPAIMKQLDEAFKSISVILLIIAGSGIFMQIMSDGGVSIYIGQILKDMQLSPLILGWLIAAIIRVCIGSATVAGLTTVGIMLPILGINQHIRPELMVLSIGAGSLMFSHVNDGGFWLFKEYFNLTIKETFLTWTVMETIVSVTGLIGVLILSHFV